MIRQGGDLLGELSFLLGIPPVVTVLATPLAEGNTSVVEPTMVIKLGKADAIKLMQTDSHAMMEFYKNLSISLAKRVAVRRTSHPEQTFYLRQHCTAGTDP